MKFPRIRFSLRTLLLASLLAGGGMLLWRVREVWAFRQYPLHELSEGTSAYLPFKARFSYSGDYLSLMGRGFALEKDVSDCVLEPASGRVAYRFPSENDLFRMPPTWHKRDDVLIVDERKVVRFPAGNVIFESDKEIGFSPTGKYLVERGDHSVRFRELASLNEISTFQRPIETYTDLIVLDDAHFIRLDYGEFPPPEGKNTYNVVCFEIGTGKQCWQFKTPDKCDSCWISDTFSNDGRTIPTGNGLVVFVTCNSLKAADDKTMDQTCYTVEIETGIPQKKEIITMPVSVEDTSKDGRYECFWDEEWSLEPNAAHDSLICETPGSKAHSVIFTLTASGSKITRHVTVSKNKQRVSACIDGNSLGVWTRRRQHFEWWGIYEQPESWLAAALLLAVLWSVRRDWKDARKIALAPKPVSPSVSV